MSTDNNDGASVNNNLPHWERANILLLTPTKKFGVVQSSLGPINEICGVDPLGHAVVNAVNHIFYYSKNKLEPITDGDYYVMLLDGEVFLLIGHNREIIDILFDELKAKLNRDDAGVQAAIQRLVALANGATERVSP